MNDVTTPPSIAARRFGASALRSVAVSLSALAALASLSGHAAICPPNLAASTTPSTDFTINGNGTVTHARTRLMWKQCNEGLSGGACSVGTVTYLTWSDALLTAKNSAFAGFNDWRLPNKQELESLVDESCYFPAINDAVFPNTVAVGTWTGTTWPTGPTSASIIHFLYGYTIAYDKTTSNSVRLVRGAQSFDTLASCNLDLNGDGLISADKDGVLLLRYLLGFRNAALIAGVPIGAARGDAQGVADFIGLVSKYDVFGRPTPTAKVLLDGLVLTRLMLSVPNSGLLGGVAIPAGAVNITAASVRTAVNTKCGTSF